MKSKPITQSRSQIMAAELRHEAANLEQEIKALLKAAEILDKAGQKDATEQVEQKTSVLKNVA